MENKVISYKNKGLTVYTLKMIAIATMFLDHFSYLIAPTNSPLEWGIHLIGRTAAPIFCFLIAEGYHYTSDKKRYLMRLLIFAVISHVPYVIYFDLSFWRATSVIWALAMGLVALIGVKNKRYSPLAKIIIVAVCCLLAYDANWHYIAVLWIVNFGLFRDNFRLQMLGFSLIGLLVYIIPGLMEYGSFVTYRFGIFLTIVFFYLYNGGLGKKTIISKWSLYLFYPLHFILLYLLKVFIFNGFV